MTTDEAAARYEAAHVAQYQGRDTAVYNPHGKPVEELPVIYGWNNGGEPGWMSGELMAEDGTSLGGHVCSSEAYMLGDLGILEGFRGDRHETFRAHYPHGYRMAFVSKGDVRQHKGLMEAYRLNQQKRAKSEEAPDGR